MLSIFENLCQMKIARAITHSVPLVSFYTPFKTSCNPFPTNFPISYPLKTSENQRFSGVFRGYKMGTLAGNGFENSYHMENACAKNNSDCGMNWTKLCLNRSVCKIFLVEYLVPAVSLQSSQGILRQKLCFQYSYCPPEHFRPKKKLSCKVSENDRIFRWTKFFTRQIFCYTQFSLPSKAFIFFFWRRCRR